MGLVGEAAQPVEDEDMEDVLSGRIRFSLHIIIFLVSKIV